MSTCTHICTYVCVCVCIACNIKRNDKKKEWREGRGGRETFKDMGLKDNNISFLRIYQTFLINK